ncbi:MAG: type I restriction endonuclease subunit R, partial [Anaerolineales bacterium]
GESETDETVRVIDWDTPANNDFFIASQLWISGEMYKRRTDLIGFVNGLPLVFVELKAHHRHLKTAYENNLRDYKTAIPQLFWYNVFIILSNGSQSVIGSLTAEWEHFAGWKKINSEGEEGVISLETMLRGTCAPARLLDVAENFVLFKEGKGGLTKLVARNHQYLGVNNAIEAVHGSYSLSPRERAGVRAGRLGVFWHTQGSGKSYSMAFFSQKILRKLPGNWTFLVITDRDDLDDQIYKNFANTGMVAEPEGRVRAASGEHLQQLLREDHRYLFTLIQKFHTKKGQTYPKLSDRSDIIVMADEAHRSQYDTFALNLRNALPRAAFIGFTGTPLMAGEEKTREVFGDYVSIYNFRQSVEDNATVPLYYENRIPELQLTNPDLNADISRVLEDAELDEAQETALEREFAREYQLITRDDRLEKIAEDLVLHFLGRGQRGKAMVVSIDKAAAVRMYDKVRKYWTMQLAYLRAELETCDPAERPDLQDKIAYLEETGMAVVVSPAQNEVADLQKKGADITSHRRRMNKEDLETKFKDPADPFRLVFVCAMWMTGFDAPACSTIYLDKPMRNHSLMQTIARANRVLGEKVNGLIVDYIGVFRDLQKALAIYGSASGGGVQAGDLPVKDKQALVDLLKAALDEATAFCASLDINLSQLDEAEGFARIRRLDDAVEAILVNDETRLKVLWLAASAARLYQAILPDRAANAFIGPVHILTILSRKIHSLAPPADVGEVMGAVEAVLDQSVAAEAYVIRAAPKTQTLQDAMPSADWIDLSQIDFEALKREFEQSRQRTEVEKLRAALNRKLKRMIRLNRTRMNYYGEFQRMIDEYNAGAANVEAVYEALLKFARSLTEEEKRGLAAQLSEEALALFDLLTKPEMKLTKKEQGQVKKVAKDLLTTLKAERLVLDWRKRQQARAAVRLAIAEALDQLPDRYTKELYDQKCEAVYQHVYDSYFGAGRSVYSVAA